ncbi:unnamed protein product [Closterium sp. NIES-54]
MDWTAPVDPSSSMGSSERRAVTWPRQVAPPCSCRLLSHHTFLWHNHIGHPSLPHLCGRHSRLLVSGLPRSLPPLPPLPAPPCLPCVEGRQRAALHSSSFPPTAAPLQTLHMDVWGPAHRFHWDLPVLRLHSDKGGELSFKLLRDFCRGEGILQSFTLLNYPQQNGIAEHRIGLVMEVARTFMIHAAAPHFLWPFAVRYAAHHLNLWPHVSLPETSPTLRWMGEVGDASMFRIWGSCAFVCDTSVDKLSARAIPYVFLGFPLDAPSWQFYHPTSHRVLPSQDCPAPSGVSHVDPLPSTLPVELAGNSGAARGTASGGVASGGVEPGGAKSEGVGSAEPRGSALSGGLAGASPRLSPRSEPLSPEHLHERFAWRARIRSGAAGAGATGDTGAGGAGVTAGAGGTGGTAATRPRNAHTRGLEALLLEALALEELEELELDGAGGAGAGGARAVDPGARGAGAGGAGGIGSGGIVRPRPHFVPLLQQPASTLPTPSPYTEQSGGLTERHPECDLVRASSLTVSLLLASVVTNPSFESTASSALVAELLDFATACRLDYATTLVAESESSSHPSIGGECALGTDVLEDRREDFECLAAAVPRFASMLLAPEGDPDAPDIPTPCSYAEAITGPCSSQWQAAMDVEMASWKSTGTCVDAVPPSRTNIIDGMWILRVKRPPGSPPTFKARYVARGFSHRQGVDYFQTFPPPRR